MNQKTEPLNCLLPVFISFTSYHADPFHTSVFARRPGGSVPPKAIAAVLVAADPVISFLALFISLTSVQDEPSQSSVAAVVGEIHLCSYGQL